MRGKTKQLLMRMSAAQAAAQNKKEDSSYEWEEEPEESEHTDDDENEDKEEDRKPAPPTSEDGHATPAEGRMESSSRKEGPRQSTRRPPSPPPPPPQGARRRDKAPPPASGALTTVCNICGHRLKGGAAALIEHQKYSSRCRYQQGLLPGHTGGGRSPCPHGCGCTVATHDDWALQQHEWFCKALQGRSTGSARSYRQSRRCRSERKRGHDSRSRSRR